MRNYAPYVRTLDYDTPCGRCGEIIEAGSNLVYVPVRIVNPALYVGRNPRAFHIDVYCDKGEKNEN